MKCYVVVSEEFPGYLEIIASGLTLVEAQEILMLGNNNSFQRIMKLVELDQLPAK